MKGIIAALLVCGFVLAASVSALAAEKSGVMPPEGKHFLGMKGTVAEYCTCGAACKCTAPEGDATTCSCGKPIDKVDLKGKYACEKCGSYSDKPAKCCCGAELKKVE